MSLELVVEYMVSPAFVEGALMTLLLTLCSIVCGVAVGLVIALLQDTKTKIGQALTTQCEARSPAGAAK